MNLYRCCGMSVFRYHDMAGVVDFVILRHAYNLSMSRDWNVG